MASFAAKRIQKELMEVVSSEEDEQSGIKVELVGEDFCELRGSITGPPDTPYEGGTFELEINIPSRYPFQPPEIRFATKVWHVNISSVTGAICLDILGSQWAASLTLRSVLLSLQILLSSPQPDDPQDGVVARQFIHNPEMFQLTARHWTSAYAGGPNRNQDFDDKIRRLMDLGHNEIISRTVLSCCDWDLDSAIWDLTPNYVGRDANNNEDDGPDENNNNQVEFDENNP